MAFDMLGAIMLLQEMNKDYAQENDDAMAQEADEEAETAQMAEYPIPDNIY